MWYPLRAFSQVLLLDAKSSNRVTFQLSTLQVLDTTFAKEYEDYENILHFDFYCARRYQHCFR